MAGQAAGPLLTVRGLKVRYGPIEAVHGIDLTIDRGEMVAVIGANGAGKTSTLLAISGVQRASEGEIRFAGRRIERMPGHDVAALGIAHVPEGRRLFARMSVWENLAMGTYAARRSPSSDDLKQVFDLFPVLEERQNQMAGTLSGGEQQMLAIGRALVSKPTLLLLDEPSMGLAPKLVAAIFRLLREINQAGVTTLLVEQNARMALRISSRAYVLETGLVTLADDAQRLLENDQVRAAYLGGLTSQAADLVAEPVEEAERGDVVEGAVEGWRQ